MFVPHEIAAMIFDFSKTKCKGKNCPRGKKIKMHTIEYDENDIFCGPRHFREEAHVSLDLGRGLWSQSYCVPCFRESPYSPNFGPPNTSFKVCSLKLFTKILKEVSV